MREIFERITANCNMSNDMYIDYLKLVQWYNSENRFKLGMSKCHSQQNIKIIGHYLNHKGL